MNWVGIGSGNGLSPVRWQAITSTNADLLSIGPLGTNFSEIQIEIKKIFIHENAFENVVCEMAAILSRGRWVTIMSSDECHSTLLTTSQHWFRSWCSQATSHYLSQCWPSSVLPYSYTRPQRVKWICVLCHPTHLGLYTQRVQGPLLLTWNFNPSMDK